MEDQPTPEALQPVDVRFLSEAELIEITANIGTALTPLGEAAFDEYMKRRSEVLGQAMAVRAIESAVQEKFAHLSDQVLISRIERAPDFGYDDEEVELSRRLKLRGLAWRWSDDLFHPRVEVFDPRGEE